MRSERTRGARRYWPALILLLMGTLAGAWHDRTVDRGKKDVVAGTVRTVVAPPASALGRVARWFSNQTGWILHGHALAEENRHLKERIAALEGENAALRERAIAGDLLRQDLGFVRKQPAPPLPADVIARRPDPKFDTILISRGSLDGIRPHSVVVTRNGLVGQVWEVTPTTSSVVLLTDQNGAAGARVQREQSRAVGICKGDYSPLVPLIDLPGDADIKPGDLIVTSGFGIFPKGLPIGKVVKVTMDEGHVSKTARVQPAVDYDRLEEVYVLR